MIPLVDARALIAAGIVPLAGARTPLAEAAGRVLREDVAAREDLPPFDRSAMDGYALAAGDRSEKFRIVADLPAGAAPKLKIGRGECARIFTGAPIPAGATQVLMQEQARVEGGFMIPLKRGRASHIRRRGEDARRGDLLLKSGSRLGPGELALLATLGVVKPRISPRVRVAHLVTGDELLAPDRDLKPGRIRDSNSTLVAALVGEFGGRLVKQERLGDDFRVLLQAARALRRSFDLLLLSGGAGGGEHDFGKRLLTELGFEIRFAGVSLRPGRPLIFATRGRQAAFVLPGNPVSHLVTLQVAVRLAFERFAGGGGTWPLARARLGGPFDFARSPRETFWPARLEIQHGELVARPLRWQSSGDVTGLNGINALLRIAPETAGPKAGKHVSVLMLDVP